MVTREPELLNAADHDRISRAVAAVESRSDVEIVTLATRRSDGYNDWALLLTLLAASGWLTIAAAVPSLLARILAWWHAGWSVPALAAENLIAALVIAVAIGVLCWIALRWMPLRLTLTPERITMGRVRREAVKAFRIGIEARTRAHTGVLIYLSLEEHRAEIVTDAAITAAVSAEAWGDAMADLIVAMKAGRVADGLVGVIEAAGVLLEPHFPLSADDRNEMPDRLIEL